MLYRDQFGTPQNPLVINLSGQVLNQIDIRNCHNVIFTADPSNPVVVNVRNTKAKGIVVSGSSNIIVEHFRLIGQDGDYLSWDAAAWRNAPARGIASGGSDGLTFRDGEICGFRAGTQIIGNNNTMQRLKVYGVCGDALRGYGSDLLIDDNDVYDLFKIDGTHVDHYQGSEHAGKGPFWRITITNNRFTSVKNNRGNPLAQTDGQGVFQRAQADGIVYNDVLVQGNVIDSLTAKAIMLKGVRNGKVLDNHIVQAHPSGDWPRIAFEDCDTVLVQGNTAQAIVDRGGVVGLAANNNVRLDGTPLPSQVIPDDDTTPPPPPVYPDDPETPEPPEVPETPEQPPAPDLAAARAALAAAQVKITEALGAIS